MSPRGRCLGEGGLPSYTEFVDATLYIDYMSGNAMIINLIFFSSHWKVGWNFVRVTFRDMSGHHAYDKCKFVSE